MKEANSSYPNTPRECNLTTFICSGVIWRAWCHPELLYAVDAAQTMGSCLRQDTNPC